MCASTAGGPGLIPGWGTKILKLLLLLRTTSLAIYPEARLRGQDRAAGQQKQEGGPGECSAALQEGFILHTAHWPGLSAAPGEVCRAPCSLKRTTKRTAMVQYFSFSPTQWVSHINDSGIQIPNWPKKKTQFSFFKYSILSYY